MARNAEELLFQEFRDEMEPAKYPFADVATLSNDEGVFIPENTFIDLSLYLIGGQGKFYLSKVVCNYDSVYLYFGDEVSDAKAYAAFVTLSPPDNLSIYDFHGRPAGVIVTDATRLGIFQTWSIGEHIFTPDQTEIVASCCIPLPEHGLRGFALSNGDILSGNVILVGGPGVVLSASTQTVVKPDAVGGSQTFQTIRVDCVGDPLFRRRLCEETFVTPRFLQSITFKQGSTQFVCYPNASGDLQMSSGSDVSPSSALRVRSLPEGLLFEVVGKQLR
jgi:hypothetical protein